MVRDAPDFLTLSKSRIVNIMVIQNFQYKPREIDIWPENTEHIFNKK